MLAAEDNLFQEDAVSWEPITICYTTDTITRLYVLFLFVAVVIGVIRIVNLWIEAPPFRLKHQTNNPRSRRLLQMLCSSTKQWMGLAILGWTFVVSYEIARLGRYADERSSTGWALVLSTTQRLGSLTELATVSLLVLFLFRWHALNRIHHLHDPEVAQAQNRQPAPGAQPEINP